jgi:D-3-phosphoglycerate dehydrogenase
MSRTSLVMAAGTFTDVGVEREHLAGEPVDLRVAPLRDAEEIAAATADADGIIITVDPMPAAHIAALGERVRVIGRAGLGLDAIDLDAAAAHGVAVVHCPDYCTEEVATHALALVLALHRRLPAGDEVARRDWRAWSELAPLRPLSELTAGVVGLGRIGRMVADRLAPLVGEVVGFDPYAAAGVAGVRTVDSLDELLAVSDLVSLHVPLTPNTAGLIGAPQLAAMKPDAVLVNVSRGGLVDHDALAEALTEGRLGAAGLDVLDREPPAPEARILAAPRVLLTPHFAWYSATAERRARTMTVDAMLDYLAGRDLRAGRIAAAPRAITA